MPEANEGLRLRETPFGLIYRHVKDSIPPYRDVLTSDADDRISDLGKLAKERLDAHIQQMAHLEQILERVKSGENFKKIVKGTKIYEREDNPRQTFTARLVPENAGFLPKDPENPQIQLSFHSNISANDPESVSDVYYALGLTRPPEAALARIFRSTDAQSAEINTVGVFIDPSSNRTCVLPYGGITFRWNQGEKKAKVGGFVYVGFQPHTMELLKDIPLADFAVIQGMVLRLSGYSPKKTTRS